MKIAGNSTLKWQYFTSPSGWVKKGQKYYISHNPY
jgi:hypothetical protein